MRCADCVYWNPPRPPMRSIGFPSDSAPGTTELAGQCRFMPPVTQVTVQGARSMWPMTSENQWCGQHATREATEAARREEGA